MRETHAITSHTTPRNQLLTVFRHQNGMSRYRRLYVPGGTYFFTVTLADRSATTLVDEIDLLRSVYGSVIKEHPITCDAMVVLPDHIHAVWTLPDNDADFSIRWKKIKGRFSQHCRAKGSPSRSKIARGEQGFGKDGFGNMPSVTRPITNHI